MPEYGFSLTHICPYKDIIEDSALMRENSVREKPYFGIFYALQMPQHSALKFQYISI